MRRQPAARTRPGRLRPPPARQRRESASRCSSSGYDGAAIRCLALTTELTACAAGWLRCAASCVAEFQDECAEEEGADGPQGDDAETLPGGERQAVQPDCCLGVQAGGQGSDLV